jgi:hypothetical protein
MKKRLLTFGYNVNQIQGLSDISYSNYSLNFSSEKRWENKLDKISELIENNELQCILIVVSKYLIDDIESLGIKRFKELLELCSKTNCFVAIQEYLQEDAPLYYDYIRNKKLTIDELEELAIEEENRYKSSPTIEIDIKDLNDDIPFDIKDILGEPPFEDDNTSKHLSDFRRKVELLRATERIFPLAKEIINILKSNFEDVMVFRYLSQIYDYIKSEIIERFSNEILNIYIPRQYGYKFEFDDFIQVFEKYLKGVEQLNISVEVNETQKGVNYKFISNDLIEKISDLPEKFQRFTNFIDICEKEPEQALQLLESKNIAPNQALEIIQRLSKKYKRLVLDIQQQQERIELAYKQEVQAELFEYGYSDTPFSLVQKSFSIEALDTIYEPSLEEQEFIRLVQTHTESIDVTNLKSDLGIINDLELKQDDRKRSAYKLKKVLGKILNKGLEHAEKIAIDALVTYINSKVG